VTLTSKCWLVYVLLKSVTLLGLVECHIIIVNFYVSVIMTCLADKKLGLLRNVQKEISCLHTMKVMFIVYSVPEASSGLVSKLGKTVALTFWPEFGTIRSWEEAF